MDPAVTLCMAEIVHTQRATKQRGLVLWSPSCHAELFVTTFDRPWVVLPHFGYFSTPLPHLCSLLQWHISQLLKAEAWTLDRPCVVERLRMRPGLHLELAQIPKSFLEVLACLLLCVAACCCLLLPVACRYYGDRGVVGCVVPVSKCCLKTESFPHN
uniref:Uncharacterized protein n=1 Tax=Eutreptiella gymnastica TaxID=73025 RepID=A0A7S1NTD2_9EUGL